MTVKDPFYKVLSWNVNIYVESIYVYAFISQILTLFSSPYINSTVALVPRDFVPETL